MISYATWPWIFYVAAILSLFTAVTCTFLVPHPYRPQHKYTQLEQIQRLDAPGGLLLMGEHCASILPYALPKSAKLHWCFLFSQ